MTERILLVFGFLVLLPSAGAAQEASALRVGATRPASQAEEPERVPAIVVDSAKRLPRAMQRIPLWAAPIASAVVPGMGQARLEKNRFVAYMAAEAYLLLQYRKHVNDVKTHERGFRALARDIARRTFPGEHADTVFQYYEKLKENLESGQFTLVPNGPTVPETDLSTYNGREWLNARKQFGVPVDDPDPASTPNYAAALAYYESRAFRQQYGWSWKNAQLEWDLFKRTIDRSNGSYRLATQHFIALIANHVLSAVDAFATVRLIEASAGSMRVSAAIAIP